MHSYSMSFMTKAGFAVVYFYPIIHSLFFFLLFFLLVSFLTAFAASWGVLSGVMLSLFQHYHLPTRMGLGFSDFLGVSGV